MPRIRSIKPEFWVDRKLAKATCRDARMLYMGLWNLADEHARLQGDPYYLKGQLFPYEPDLGPAEIETLLGELIAFGAVRRYLVDDEPYLFLPMLAKHQRLEPEKVASKHPAPPEVWPDDASSQVRGLAQTSPDPAQIFSDESARDADKNALLYVAGSMEHVGPDSDESARPAKPSRKKPATALPANFTIDDGQRSWARKKYPIVDIDAETEKFKNHALAKDLRYADWAAAWRTWLGNAQTFAESRGGKPVPAQRPPVDLDKAWMRGVV